MRRSQRGSALVFVLIIIAGIVTVTVGTQRLSLVQFNQATREEDNTFALYAAKAGLEDGLLRFRYERDVETVSDQVHRFNITKGEWVSNREISKDTAINATPNYAASDQYYDLSINFKTNQIGDFVDMPQSPEMKQDEEIQLTGFPNIGNDYYLRYAFQWANAPGCQGRGAFVQIQEISPAKSGNLSLGQTIVRIPATGNPATYQSNANQANILLKNSTSLTSVIRVRAYHCPVRFAFKTSLSNNGLGNGNNAGPAFDSLETKIKATGYFGTAKRTLEATVDRKSGRLISVYDFNIYSGQGCVSSTLNLSDCAP